MAAMNGYDLPRNDFSIPQGEVKKSTEPVFHDRLRTARWTGVVEMELVTLQPVHVGSGAFAASEDGLLKDSVQSGGRLVIPGTSLKGMCRQTYEALTASPEPFREMYNRRKRTPLSAAAALFGALGYQGRVSFDDVAVPADCSPVEILLPVPYQPKSKSGRRFYGEMTGGGRERTIPARAIPQGVTLTVSLRCRNVTAAELGGVLLSLGVGRFAPRLGGGKYDGGYGRVRFQVRRFRFRSDDLLSRPSWRTDDGAVAEWMRTAEAVLSEEGRKNLDVLTRRLRMES